ncbi:hypothetical protein SKAU_G00095880 [Synaphobranchus kaupii]|uniref:SCAN box domain-containing protein n=1 Tax=Synaphobranchus kaupii TaxID=118154 RepID=A0A9Q1FXL6_SYNKA|nr:hypothetical protein SKAU_G00095880 [Synaphobranchus kaupii]
MPGGPVALLPKPAASRALTATKRPQSTTADLPTAASSAQTHLTKMTEGDDVEAYLHTFELLQSEKCRFQTWTYHHSEPPRTQLTCLRCLAARWLPPDHLTSYQMLDKLVLDRFIRGLPFEAKKLAGQHTPADFSELLALMEWVDATQEMLRQPEQTARG